MSFSSQVKQELCAHIIEKPCCARAFCWGAAGFSHTLTSDRLEFHTESDAVARYLRTMFAGQGVRLQLGSFWVHGHEKLALATAEQGAEQLAEFAAAAGLSDSTELPGSEKNVFAMRRCPGCFGAYLAGAFLSGGFISDPQREYRLEFFSQHPDRLRALAALLSEQGLEPFFTRKKANDVLCLRSSEQIEDLLAAMGAAHSAMEIMDTKIYKTYRNQANRVTNCESANIDKTVEANQKAVQAIRLLQSEGVLDTLPQPLQDAAMARLNADPSVTLAELAAEMQPPVSKSGLAHRMKKLVTFAEELAARRAQQENVRP